METILERGRELLEGVGRIKSIKRISGGDINEAYYVRTCNHEYFVKLNKQVDLSFFESEAEGLKLIRQTRTIAVPEVYEVFSVETADSSIPMLWMEWVHGPKHADTEKRLGEQLAALHLCEGKGYGYEKDSYIGRLKQKNYQTASWLSYYRNERIGGQLKYGQKLGTISGKREERLMKLIERLDEWVPEKPRCSLLHGDLWSGNWMTGKEGKPYLIDPSVLYGDHEFEIAFTELFGGFSEKFYQAYQSVFPLSNDYEDRREIYQLYYILVHLNMFGESYGSAVDRILSRYT